MLKLARLKKGLTQDQLSILSGISQSYISKLENEDFKLHSPTLKQIVKLAKVLNICPVNLAKWFLGFHMNCSNNCLQISKPEICKHLILLKKF